MDKQIVEELKQQRQDALDVVAKEMAFEEEKCRITLDKVQSRFVMFLLRAGYRLNEIARSNLGTGRVATTGGKPTHSRCAQSCDRIYHVAPNF